ncbi:MAG: GTPase Era [Gammaproteobacteria bacterium]|nr:GTPase Era [Gammaproteobacteria bacterium]
MRCGYVAIAGRPNVGKSTLLNRILGQKLSITSRRPQTTRHRILGVKTTADAQTIYIDTPGLHKKGGRELNRFMNREALHSLDEVDLVLFVVDAQAWRNDDDWILEKLVAAEVPIILVLNKVDEVKNKEDLLPRLQEFSAKHAFIGLVPISAKGGNGVEELERVVAKQLPEGELVFPPEQLTDRSERFLAAELVREKAMRLLGQEVPYQLTVEIEKFKEEKKIVHIAATIWVERDTQKGIVIGKGGELLKKIGSQARVDMEKLFGKQVFLEMHVRVKEGWSDDARLLKKMGYDEPDA